MNDRLLIEELSFPVYRRVSTVIFTPGQSPHASSVELVTIKARTPDDSSRDGRRFVGGSGEKRRQIRNGRAGPSNIIEIISPDWRGWLKLGARVIGCQ